MVGVTMLYVKNRLMLWVSAGAILLSVVVHLLGRMFHLLDFSHGAHLLPMSEIEQHFHLALNIFFFIPIVFL
jgi:methyl-accepting chemotaxis protein